MQKNNIVPLPVIHSRRKAALLSKLLILTAHRSFYDMANQHGCGYGTNAAGNGGDRAYDRLCILELHVAAKLAFRIHIDADIDNYLAGCKVRLVNYACAACSHDQDIRLTAYSRHIHGLRMAVR